ncbi:class A beta-lactamase, subclass A2 [Croceivirga sp. JEA036]|uniref:class A beta-lactamase, subclass A2 n=1 Tax=Croceivirga sp. JEA036 TaxID=2721162 RepID=UPI00143CA456|nr:class A beta-lactamase, subclass A2 [Croceivirga sp. JEA036]NJB37580.1 class A beta-lactamase, subclass A2 [Croceivirga sp. JEA036]
MYGKITLLLVLLISLTSNLRAQNDNQLGAALEALLNTKKALIGVAIDGPKDGDSIRINADMHYPMQSIFKLHIALTILAEVDKGNLSLNQTVLIKKNELLPGLWSPIREDYPEGASLSLAKVLEYTVALSDNAGCDALLRLLGGPEKIENHFHNLGFTDFEVKINEEEMQNNWDKQFLNWTTPTESNRVLNAFFTNKQKLLSNDSHTFFWDVLKNTKTGKKRLRGLLPKETIVAHKTGYSGVHKITGVSAAVNNVGIVYLPNGDTFTISVFITNSTEDTATNERLIAEICKAAWDYFNES